MSIDGGNYAGHPSAWHHETCMAAPLEAVIRDKTGWTTEPPIQYPEDVPEEASRLVCALAPDTGLLLVGMSLVIFTGSLTRMKKKN